MKTGELLELFDELTGRCRVILAQKNRDYTAGAEDALANFKAAAWLGAQPETGLMLRMGDKLMRVRAFVERGALAVPGESEEDAVMDLVNYTVLLGALLRERRVRRMRATVARVAGEACGGDCC